MDRLAHIETDLGGIDVEGGHDGNVADVIATQLDVHEARNPIVRVGLAVVLEALHE